MDGGKKILMSFSLLISLRGRGSIGLSKTAFGIFL